MIESADLRAAVAAGVLSEGQAASLATLAAARRAGRAALRAGEEPFALFRGFNEIFIVVGLGILAVGWFGVWAAALVASADFDATAILAGVATLAVVAALSEYFTRRRRMVAPAIALTLAWAATAVPLWIVWTGRYSVLGGIDLEAATLPMAAATATILLYWARYRVPFALAVLAASGFACLIVALAATSGRPATFDTLFVLSASGPFAVSTLIFGLALFGLAMRFDMADPHRLGLRSANGFWLHVAAAPAIVNTVALTLLDRGTAPAATALAGFLLALAVVAVVIDRRSFLVAAAGYVVAVVSATTGGTAWTAATILVLGAALVALGAGWQAARAVLLRPVPGTLRRRLPPSA